MREDKVKIIKIESTENNEINLIHAAAYSILKIIYNLDDGVNNDDISRIIDEIYELYGIEENKKAYLKESATHMVKDFIHNNLK